MTNPFERRFSMSKKEREAKIQKKIQLDPKKTYDEAAQEVDMETLAANNELKELKESEQPRIEIPVDDPELYEKLKEGSPE